MPPIYHVIGGADGDRPWVLNLEPATYTEAQRKISWQRRFDTQPEGYWKITEYLPSQGFVDQDGVSYVPGIGPYTQEAWAAFWRLYE